MPGSNRRRSSSPLAALKSYISPQNLRAVMPTRRALRPGESGYIDGWTTMQSWSQWASERIGMNGSSARTTEEVTLFPGWASRRYIHESMQVSYCFSFI
jgi:hypothetical protein